MKTIHIVTNAHLDPAWLWDWREGMNEGIATCHAMVELLEENPDVTFARGESLIYEHIERHDPDLFRRIERLIEEGRWEIIGGSYLQPDTNLGSGEAYVRQYLYGQEYFRSRFDFVPQVVFQIDSFGHAAGLPTIYRHAGCRYAIHTRPSQGEFSTPSRLFRWQGPDGSEIITANVEAYAIEMGDLDNGGDYGQFTLSPRMKRAVEQIPDGLDDWVFLVGMGDHGGGLNRKLLAEIREHTANAPEGVSFKFSTLHEFFSRVSEHRESLPIVTGELNFCHRGCYTSVAPIKRAYRNAECLVDFAERASSVASMLNLTEYPEKRLRGIWMDVLFNQFHDILPGTSIQTACDDALDQLGRARHESRRVINDALLPIALNIDTAAHQGVPVLLFNPHETDYAGPVEVEWLGEYRPVAAGFERKVVRHARVIGPDGRSAATQFLRTESNMGTEWRYRSCFLASVPACGYAMYWLRQDTHDLPVPDPVEVHQIEDGFELSNSRVRLSYRHGERGIRVVGPDGKELFAGPAGAGVVFEDKFDSWAMGRRSWDKELGFFEPVSARLVESGPIKSTLQIVSRYQDSELMQEFSVHSGVSQVSCEARLNWNTTEAMCKLSFPIDAKGAVGFYSGPYCTATRPANLGEVPGAKWISVIGECCDFGLANDGRYGFDLTDGELTMSIVRSSVYGGAEHNDYSCRRPPMDIGMHRFGYAVGESSGILAASDVLNMPLQTVLSFPHAGSLPASQSVLSISPGGIRLVSLKMAENRDGWILRLWNSSNDASDCEVTVLCRVVTSVKLMPFEIRSLRVTNSGGVYSARECSLNESPETNEPVYGDFEPRGLHRASRRGCR